MKHSVVASLIRKAVKESKTPYSYMDTWGVEDWIKKHVTQRKKKKTNNP